MGLLIINTDYPEFLCWLYAQHPELEVQTYEERMRRKAVGILRPEYQKNILWERGGERIWEKGRQQ